MDTFLSKHAKDIIGTLSGFDRLVFRGTLRSLVYVGGMKSYLYSTGVLLKDFAGHALDMTKRLKKASLAETKQVDRPVHYLPSSKTSKEYMAREIAEKDGITEGPVCILTAVEPCNSFEIYRNSATKYLELVPRQRKCLHIYQYQIHPVFGFMNARIQTWFPFNIQICINGREWLARQMDEAGLNYRRADNCFPWISDPVQAQRLMDQQLRSSWPDLLEGVARTLNPLHQEMFSNFPVDYYWSTHQSEWATDIMFRDTATLAHLYPKLVHHGLVTFMSPDIMRFLGRNIPPGGNIPKNFNAEVVSDIKKRVEGVRIKHRHGNNSIKLYDKQGSIMRVETLITDPSDYKSFRTPEGQPEVEKKWLPMRKGIADLHRCAEVSQAANNRYIHALASVENTTSVGELTVELCRPSTWQGKRVRAMNPFSLDDANLIEIISRGEFTENGFRNRDVRVLLFPGQSTPEENRRYSAAVTRKFLLLRAHGLIKKVTGTHRYQVTDKGRNIVTALITTRNASTESLTKLAA